MTAAVQVNEAGWQARLELRFERHGPRSVLARHRHTGPLRVQRPFYPEDASVCHVYLLHPPGGVVSGDELDIDVTVGSEAMTLLTTPAAGKFYRSNGLTAYQKQTLRVAAGASLEWFPQETIVFDGARAIMSTQVELEADARFMGWEILCLGRPGAGESFVHGQLRQRWEVWRNGRPLFIERALYEEGGAAMIAPWGLAGQPVCGSFIAVGHEPGLCERIREATSQLSIAGLFTVTQLDEALVCRYLGPHGEEARRCFIAAWEHIRPASLQRQASAPRIWAT